MATEFILPELGENIESADVVDVLVSVGDNVEVDDPILEIETDKASFEVPSTVRGVIKELRVSAGDSAKVGQVVMVIEESADSESSDESPDDAPSGQEAEQEPKEEQASGDTQTQTKESEPAAATAVSEAPTESRAQVDLSSTPEPVAEEPSPNGTSSGTRELVPAAPSTRRLAREIGVDIHQVKGTGPGGRISQVDVKNHAKSMLSGAGAPAASAPATAASAPVVKLPDFSKFGSVTREKMSNVRRATANQMHLNWTTIPQVTQFDKADITDLESLRKQLNKKRKEGDPKITVTAILLRVLSSALKKFPQFNASVDLANEEVVYKDYFNIGVAVDTERGLLVPVVREVDKKNVKELAADLTEIAKKARDRKIRPEDFQGSCITISNLGGIGGVGFTPIVNSPEVAIVGVSRASMELVYHDETFYARLIMPICLSYDHRLIDGADAARFLRWVCDALENPALLAFEG